MIDTLQCPAESIHLDPPPLDLDARSLHSSSGSATTPWARSRPLGSQPDAKLGHILRMQPAALQQAILHTYGAVYRLYLSYGSNPSFGCTATLPQRSAPSGIGFGVNPYRPFRPYLTISANASEALGPRSDIDKGRDVSPVMRIWQGTTPDGYALLVERDDRGPWVVTVASVSRSRNDSLEEALIEAGGGSVPRAWAEQAAKLIRRHEETTDALSVPGANASRTGAA
jgi:hypothetical protein